MTTRGALILGFAAMCLALPAAQSSQELTDVHGTIEEVNPRNGWYAIVPDDDAVAQELRTQSRIANH